MLQFIIVIAIICGIAYLLSKKNKNAPVPDEQQVPPPTPDPVVIETEQAVEQLAAAAPKAKKPVTKKPATVKPANAKVAPKKKTK